jgi:hypothetical protein
MDLTIEEYSEKSIVLRGNTRAYSQELTELSGLYNHKLRGGPGWIFSKNRREKIEEFVKKLTQPVEESKPQLKHEENVLLSKIAELESKIDKILSLLEAKNTIEENEILDDDEPRPEPRKRLLR